MVEQLTAFAAAKKGPLKSEEVPFIHFQQPSEASSLAPIQCARLPETEAAMVASASEVIVTRYPAQPFARADSAAVFAAAKSTACPTYS